MECALVPRLAAAARVALGSRVWSYRAQRLHVRLQAVLLVRSATPRLRFSARREQHSGPVGPPLPPTAD